MKRDAARQLLRDLEEPTPEKQLRVEVDEDLDDKLEKIFKLYKKLALEQTYAARFPEYEYKFDSWVLARGLEKGLKTLAKQVTITPHIIEEFVLRLEKYYKSKTAHNFSENTGVFISTLISISYKQGHNNFHIPLIASERLESIMYLCGRLDGETGKPIEISVVGSPDYGCLDRSKNLTVKLTDMPTDWTGLDGRITGYATNCTLKSERRDVLDTYAKGAGEGCKFYLIKDGKEELIAET